METTFTLSASRYWIPWIFAKGKPDVVIAVMPPLQIGVWPLVYSWIRGVPWILHVQDLQVDAALRLNMLRGRGLVQFLYNVERYLLRHATRVSTITPVMRERVTAKGVTDERVWLLPNWADLSFVRPMERDNTFRSKIGIARHSKLVICAGNMGEKQGLEVVLEASLRLRERSDIRILLVGDGVACSRLKAAAKRMGLPNVKFLPVQPWEAVPEMLAAADIHLIIQRRKAADLVMPSKLTNVLAAGRSCVATADRGTTLWGVVVKNRVGLAVPPEDPTALADAIQTLADSEAERLEYERNARCYAEKWLDRDRILERFEAQIAELPLRREGH